MFNDIILSIIQSVTEFLPISSSGHLALASNLISEPDLFFFTILHLASLIAVVIFTRKEIKELLSFKAQ
ncbi:MAG: undecaprenyl-diphosphate phosphatase, partial [Candidatus Omnitrophica bacterium]|nr:undecaprenyl-diphosphate phosphatase [Candidatus Omnitrophota bacterium]